MLALQVCVTVGCRICTGGRAVRARCVYVEACKALVYRESNISKFHSLPLKVNCDGPRSGCTSCTCCCGLRSSSSIPPRASFVMRDHM